MTYSSFIQVVWFQTTFVWCLISILVSQSEKIVHYATSIVLQSSSSFYFTNFKSTLRCNLFGGNLVVSLRSRRDHSREESFGRGAVKPWGERGATLWNFLAPSELASRGKAVRMVAYVQILPSACLAGYENDGYADKYLIRAKTIPPHSRAIFFFFFYCHLSNF